MLVIEMLVGVLVVSLLATLVAHRLFGTKSDLAMFGAWIELADGDHVPLDVIVRVGADMTIAARAVLPGTSDAPVVPGGAFLHFMGPPLPDAVLQVKTGSPGDV